MSSERQYSNKIDLLISKLNMNSIGEKENDLSSELDLAQSQSTLLKESSSDTGQQDGLNIKRKSRKDLEDLLVIIYEALEYGLSKGGEEKKCEDEINTDGNTTGSVNDEIDHEHEGDHEHEVDHEPETGPNRRNLPNQRGNQNDDDGPDHPGHEGRRNEGRRNEGRRNEGRRNEGRRNNQDDEDGGTQTNPPGQPSHVSKIYNALANMSGESLYRAEIIFGDITDILRVLSGGSVLTIEQRRMHQDTLTNHMLELQKVLDDMSQTFHSQEDFLNSRVNYLKAEVDELSNKVSVLWRENFQLTERISKHGREKFDQEQCHYDAINEERKSNSKALDEERKSNSKALDEERKSNCEALHEQRLIYYNGKNEILSEMEKLEDKLRVANRKLKDKYPDNESIPDK
ncbi:hypothetical protein MOSE0_I06964 [Monosporozyma servazzii]